MDNSRELIDRMPVWYLEAMSILRQEDIGLYSPNLAVVSTPERNRFLGLFWPGGGNRFNEFR